MTDSLAFPSLTLLGDLDSSDRAILFSMASERHVIIGERLIVAGTKPEAIYVVLTGLLEVAHAAVDDRLATLGPGDIAGEVSFVQGDVASADVRAIENSLLLQLPVTRLRAQMAEDAPFAARFAHALAATLALRLRRTNELLERARAAGSLPLSRVAAGVWPTLDTAIDAMKQELVAVDQAALKHNGQVPADLEARVRAGFTALVAQLNATIGVESGLDERTCKTLGARVQAELLPYVLLTHLGERMYAKPRGYAGDFLTIDYMYADAPTGTGRLGPLLDRCLLDQSAGVAVQNRRGLLVEEIRAVIDAHPDRAVQVTSMASGPAAEIFDAFATLDTPERLQATCIDIDTQALEFVAARLPAALKHRVRLEHGNLVYLALGRTRIDLEPQDLVYSIGLIDYFNDKFVVNLLNFVHDRLRPGGRCILGNFHPRNPSRALMDHVLDWPLIHRTEDDMCRLFAASAFGAPCGRIRFEASGVNMFAVGVRQA